ncbi:hypothetical protein [Paracoccus sp. SSJ]|uniref:hypothetical protein n=1 Tax=Paracoccus sp. SSJ TaxID=3050636 RepID=UPI00254E1A56|nr:hypothetical protein [Paracoccus sp. SSJ]MDK8871611.1 hypothetical protein [Paracoccus sp. SSJ]
MKRRFFLGLAPTIIAARATSSSHINLPTIQERIDHHAAEILGMVREIAPSEIGAISVNLSENWHEQGTVGRWWHGTGASFRWREYDRGTAQWVQDRAFHLNPENLAWS